MQTQMSNLMKFYMAFPQGRAWTDSAMLNCKTLYWALHSVELARFVHRAAWSILECARRTSTFPAYAFREQEDDQATPSPPIRTTS